MQPIWELLLQTGITQAELNLVSHAFIVIIMIPIVTTILAILRYIVGIKSPSIFAVLILTFAFFDFANQNTLNQDFVQGLKYTSLLYFVVMITATITYGLIRQFRMHYIPKMSIVFTAVSISYVLLFIFSRAADMGSLLLTNTFVLIAVAVLAENIVTSYARKDLRYSVDLSIRTYVISLLCFVIISIEAVQNLFLSYPILIVLIVILNIYIGKFKGLRLTEYFRFKSILFSNNKDEQTKPDSTK